MKLIKNGNVISLGTSMEEREHKYLKHIASALSRKRPANSPCVSQAGVHRCGSNWSISLARCVGSRVSTSLR